ncbi:LytR C-terminal domain-containing protein [Gemmatimonas sp.]|jgi:hypothetical protein|uniref:LytR C-terminal domain-containing protein n=1 Tax=Gemmatimonas sp. TaxID=1962908 RepID=UPI0037BF6F0C
MNTGFPTPPSEDGKSGSGRTIAALSLVLLVVGGSVVAWWTRGGGTDAPTGRSAVATTDTTARPPQNQRVRVRVVNASGVNGLARRATLYLREFGYDVVDFSSSSAGGASTRIVVHTGHRDWGERLQRALGVGTVGADADSSRYVDLTVFIGRDWRVPTETLGP